jgi:hypothetical protein
MKGAEKKKRLREKAELAELQSNEQPELSME